MFIFAKSVLSSVKPKTIQVLLKAWIFLPFLGRSLLDNSLLWWLICTDQYNILLFYKFHTKYLEVSIIFKIWLSANLYLNEFWQAFWHLSYLNSQNTGAILFTKHVFLLKCEKKLKLIMSYQRVHLLSI